MGDPIAAASTGPSRFDRTVNRVVARRDTGGVRHLHPADTRAAEGTVGAIYRQILDEFLLAAPFIAHSVDPPLLAGLWGGLRETLLVGTLPRGVKEAMAATVSRLNRCPYCVEAHGLTLEALFGHRAAVGIEEGDLEPVGDTVEIAFIRWSVATRAPSSDGLAEPPFGPETAAEAVGTIFVFDYLNRMASVFCPDSATEVPGGLAPLRRLVRWAMRPFMRSLAHRRLTAGRSLQFLPQAPLPTDLAWAGANPVVAATMAGWAAVVEDHARPIGDGVHSALAGALERWQGEDLDLTSTLVDDLSSGLPSPQQEQARFALLVAFAPYRVGDEEVDALRRIGSRDAEILSLAAWSSHRTARRVAGWSYPTSERGADEAD